MKTLDWRGEALEIVGLSEDIRGRGRRRVRVCDGEGGRGRERERRDERWGC